MIKQELGIATCTIDFQSLSAFPIIKCVIAEIPVLNLTSQSDIASQSVWLNISVQQCIN